jgi:hypothetical protein
LLDTSGELGRIAAQIDRQNATVSQVRLDIAVLLVRFDHLDRDQLTDEDLEKLEQKIMATVDARLIHISEEMRGANREQSKDLMAEWRAQREADSQRRGAEQLADREAIIRAIEDRRSKIGWWVMGIIGGLLVTALGTVAGIMITKMMTGG